MDTETIAVYLVPNVAEALLEKFGWTRSERGFWQDPADAGLVPHWVTSEALTIALVRNAS